MFKTQKQDISTSLNYKVILIENEFSFIRKSKRVVSAF